MTTRKSKKQKLRNAEYYDCQAKQDELYLLSCESYIFKDLLNIITAEENILLAYRNIKKNNGSRTAGVDEKTIKDIDQLPTEKLVSIVRGRLKHYIPQPVKRVEIPKPGNPNKKRPLGIPTIMDRLIQQCILQVLEPICEAKFYRHSYGFRPNRSTSHAVSQAMTYMQRRGLHYVVDVDIKSFFDCVNHGKLLKQLWTLGIRDKKLLCIISAMLKAEVAGIGFPKMGTPQGGIISPLLSNVVLNELDWWIVSQWENFPTKRQYKGSVAPNGTVSQNGKYQMLRYTSSLKECYIVRYADDFRIFCKTLNEAKRLYEGTRLWLKERLGLDISPEKSKIINLKKRATEFLGISIKLHSKGRDAKGQQKHTVISHITDKASVGIKKQAKTLIKNMQRPKGNRSAMVEIGVYNSFVMGTHNYYQMATCVALDFGKIAFSVSKNLKHSLDFKREGTIRNPVIAEKYGASKQMLYWKESAVIPIGYVRHKSPMAFRKDVNQYTPAGRVAIHKNLEKVNIATLHYLMSHPNQDRSIEYNDNRLALYCAQGGKCAVTRRTLEIGDIHCHHAEPTALGGTDSYKNLLIVSKKVHHLIHATRHETISQIIGELNLTKVHINKINVLRKKAQLPEINVT